MSGAREKGNCQAVSRQASGDRARATWRTTTIDGRIEGRRGRCERASNRAALSGQLVVTVRLATVAAASITNTPYTQQPTAVQRSVPLASHTWRLLHSLNGKHRQTITNSKRATSVYTLLTKRADKLREVSANNWNAPAHCSIDSNNTPLKLTYFSSRRTLLPNPSFLFASQPDTR